MFSLLGLLLAPQVACEVPAPARQLRYEHCSFDARPTVADISTDNRRPSVFYVGQWYSKTRATLDGLSDGPDGLRIAMGQEIAGVTRESRAGLLPLITLDRGFYIQFVEKISDNDVDHWPAVWLMPVEHNAKLGDQDITMPPRFEHWLELDVDEGGLGPGTHGVVIEWTGKWPNYHRNISENGTGRLQLDRTKFHAFGLSYEPRQQRFTWWLDGRPTHSSVVSWVPPFSYYPIVSALSHGSSKPYALTPKSKPYVLTLKRLTVFTP
jgi:hypothetical protein